MGKYQLLMGIVLHKFILVIVKINFISKIFQHERRERSQIWCTIRPAIFIPSSSKILLPKLRGSQRCVELKGEEFAPCDWFKNAYVAACPQLWLEGFEAAIEKGAFQVKGAAFNS